VSAGLRDVLGMTQGRKEHPKATWQEIEAAVDERMNQLRAQIIQDNVQMGELRDGTTCRQRSVRGVRPVASHCGHGEIRHAGSKRMEKKPSS